MKFIRYTFAVVFIIALTITSLVFASVPNTLSYQGTLTDKSGNPITATKTIDFKLYDVATGGTALWAETQTVTVSSGRFGVVLGIVTPFDKSILTGNTWIGITVQGEAEMTPRQKLTSVAYALVAETVADPTALTPPGIVSAFAGSAAPAGWLVCDGAQVSRTTYANLFAAIGTAHGSGDGSTTFHLPDYRGRFLRGVDGTAGNDPDKTARTVLNTGGNSGNSVGSLQNDDYKSHNHTMRNYSPLFSGDLIRNYIQLNSTSLMNPIIQDMPEYTTKFAGGSETRPKNVNVNWIIKY